MLRCRFCGRKRLECECDAGRDERAYEDYEESGWMDAGMDF